MFSQKWNVTFSQIHICYLPKERSVRVTGIFARGLEDGPRPAATSRKSIFPTTDEMMPVNNKGCSSTLSFGAD